MTVTYVGFKTKYSSFLELPESEFNSLLPDATADVDRYNWQLLGVGWEGFKDRAIENLLACWLSSANPEYLGSAGVAEFDVREAGYRVKYLSNSSGQRSNPYCLEYQRLLAMLQAAIEAANPNASKLPASTIVVRKKVYW
jgi:hypothetical protein